MNEGPHPEFLLVLGGARSGKSSWALRYVEQNYPRPFYLATATVEDEEMAERIRRHREDRGDKWSVVEEPVEVPRTLEGLWVEAGAVLVDCLTLWLSNLVMRWGPEGVEPYMERMEEAILKRKRPLVAVSNEVGLGIVPGEPLGRLFRDLAGSMNQRMAALADRVVFTIAGIPLVVKGAPLESEGRRELA